MAALQMYIDKFERVVLIDEDHPLVVAQRDINRAKETAIKADTRKPRGAAATRSPASTAPVVPPAPPVVPIVPDGELFTAPPEERDAAAVQAYLEALSYAELQGLAKGRDGIAANQSRDDLVVLLTIALTTATTPAA